MLIYFQAPLAISTISHGRISRDVYSQPHLSKATSIMPNYINPHLNTTIFDKIKIKKRTNQENMFVDEYGSTRKINKRNDDILSKWALNHSKCGTNITSYVGQTAKMHCCLARLDRDLSVRNVVIWKSWKNILPIIFLFSRNVQKCIVSVIL